MTNNKLIGSGIKTIRKHLGFKQKDFAKSLNISGGFLSEIECGKKNPSMDVLNALVDKFQINVSYLFTGKGNYFIHPEKERANDSEGDEYIPPDEMELLDEMSWYIDHIPVARFAVLEFFKTYLYNKRGMIEKEVERYLKKKKNKEK